MSDISVEKVMNGYVIRRLGTMRIANTLEDVLEHFLLHFEGRSDGFTGDSYGKIEVYRCTCHKSDNCACDKCQYPAGRQFPGTDNVAVQ